MQWSKIVGQLPLVMLLLSGGIYEPLQHLLFLARNHSEVSWLCHERYSASSPLVTTAAPLAKFQVVRPTTVAASPLGL